MWFVFRLSGIWNIPPCVKNVVSFEEESNHQGENRLLRELVQDLSPLAGGHLI